ncbi:T9SS type A sorting domain-containing protein [Chryseobacterium chendengshani]|uniref:T9SS type A sorting domain-containing protein n=1 Tax=Chryseobacterium sp. LJ756 TaxID=2864113 RepID=UPI001C63C8E0|nr:T9SS type A sorting domain-containing protein [Chryseobacterium sp. LJ756]MBW7673970.1 T9SS type A sorting domain-containing protein [Chryseobacterium sp. LJ756]
MRLQLLLGTLVFSAATTNAQIATIDETFESAVISTPANYNNLVNGWTKKVTVSAPHSVYVDQANGNKYAQFYAAGSTSTDVFLVSPQIVAPDGSQQITFTATPTGGATLEVALVDNPESLVANTGVPTSYQIIQTYTFSSSSTPTITPVTVPASTKQYIVFRFRNPQLMGPPGVSHAALSIDNVKYNTAAVLATNDVKKPTEQIKFVINPENTELQFISKSELKNVHIYSAGGAKVAEGKPKNQQFDIRILQTGVYFIVIEGNEGTVVKSKFIKK